MKIYHNLLKVSYYCFFIALLFNSTFVAAAVLYSNDFDGNVSIDSGVSVSGFNNGTLKNAQSGFGSWSGFYFDNRSTGNPATLSRLTLSGLAAHTTIDINFILGFLESWDSTNGSVSPDYLDFYIDGTKVATLTSNNTTGSIEQYQGGSELYDNVQANDVYFYDDTLVDMSTAGFLNFAHSSSTLTFDIQAIGAGWQGGSDEAWGIDNLVIEYDVITEPLSIALLGLGLIGISFCRQKNETQIGL